MDKLGLCSFQVLLALSCVLLLAQSATLPPSTEEVSNTVTVTDMPAEERTDETTAETTKPDDCISTAEVAFVLDSSGSVGVENFEKMKAFAQDVTIRLDSFYDKLNVTLISFNNNPTIQIHKDEYNVTKDILDAMAKLTYSHGGTNTHTALQLMFNTSFHRDQAGAKIAIVVTDGASFEPDLTRQAATAAKLGGVIIFVVGVGDDINTHELSAISSDPESKFLYLLQKYDALPSVVKTITSLVHFGSIGPCSGIATSVTGSPITVTGAPSLGTEETHTVSPGIIIGKTPTAKPSINTGITPTLRPGTHTFETPTVGPKLTTITDIPRIQTDESGNTGLTTVTKERFTVVGNTNVVNTGETSYASPGTFTGVTPSGKPGIITYNTPSARPPLNTGETPTLQPGTNTFETPSIGPKITTTTEVPGLRTDETNSMGTDITKRPLTDTGITNVINTEETPYASPGGVVSGRTPSGKPVDITYNTPTAKPPVNTDTFETPSIGPKVTTTTEIPGLQTGETVTVFTEEPVTGLTDEVNTGETSYASPGTFTGVTPSGKPGIITYNTPSARPPLNTGETPTLQPGTNTFETPSIGPKITTTTEVPGLRTDETNSMGTDITITTENPLTDMGITNVINTEETPYASPGGIVSGRTPSGKPVDITYNTPTAKPPVNTDIFETPSIGPKVTTTTEIPGLQTGETVTVFTEEPVTGLTDEVNTGETSYASPGTFTGVTPSGKPGIITYNTPSARPPLNTGETPTLQPGTNTFETPSVGAKITTTTGVPGLRTDETNSMGTDITITTENPLTDMGITNVINTEETPYASPGGVVSGRTPSGKPGIITYNTPSARPPLNTGETPTLQPGTNTFETPSIGPKTTTTTEVPGLRTDETNSMGTDITITTENPLTDTGITNVINTGETPYASPGGVVSGRTPSGKPVDITYNTPTAKPPINTNTIQTPSSEPHITTVTEMPGQQTDETGVTDISATMTTITEVPGQQTGETEEPVTGGTTTMTPGSTTERTSAVPSMITGSPTTRRVITPGKSSISVNPLNTGSPANNQSTLVPNTLDMGTPSVRTTTPSTVSTTTTTIETTSTTTGTTTTASCEAKIADVVFVVDSSGSVGLANFEKVKQFIKEVILTFDVDSRYTRVALIEFSTKPDIQFKLNEHANITDLLEAVDNINYSGGGTSTSDALELMRLEGFDRERPQAPDIAIIITDGLSKYPSLTRAQAQLAKDEGITLFAIGIGNETQTDELRAIASKNLVFEVGDFDKLTGSSLDNVIAHSTCGVNLPEAFHTRKTTLPPTPPHGCIDLDIKCESYHRDTCSDYEPYARVNCAKKCGFCGAGSNETQECEDQIHNCDQYGTDMCSSMLQYDWVDEHCRKFCGFCGNKTELTVTTPIPTTTTPGSTTEPSCRDVIGNCDQYGGLSMCQTYGSWAKTNCPKYCGYCLVYQTVTSATVNNIKCPQWQLPEVCTLDYSGATCCPMPKCPDGYRLTVDRNI